MRRIVRLGGVVVLWATTTLTASCYSSHDATPVVSSMTLSPRLALFRSGPLAERNRRRFVSPALGRHILYVSMTLADLAIAYRTPNRRNKLPFCGINVGLQVQLIDVDKNGLLWVPRTSLRDVASYGPHCGKQQRTLSMPSGSRTEIPSDIAFDSSGTAYVGAYNIPGIGSRIEVYAPGSNYPTRSLTDASLFQVFGVAVDSKDNVFASTFDGNYQAHIVEFKQGQMPGSVLNLAVQYKLGNLTFDSADRMISPTAQSDGSYVVDIWDPPYTANPRQIPLQGQTLACSLGPSGSNLACAAYSATAVDIYNYATGQYLYSFKAGLAPNSLPAGLAYDPTRGK